MVGFVCLNAEISSAPADAVSDVGGAEHREDQVQGFRSGRPSDRTTCLEGLLRKGLLFFCDLLVRIGLLDHDCVLISHIFYIQLLKLFGNRVQLIGN